MITSTALVLMMTLLEFIMMIDIAYILLFKFLRLLLHIDLFENDSHSILMAMSYKSNFVFNLSIVCEAEVLFGSR